MTALILLLFSVGAGENALACADLDGDHHADVLVADERAATLTLWTGAGDGTLKRGATLSVAANPTDLVIADLNADNHPDLVIAHHELNLVSVHLNNGQGDLSDRHELKPNVDPHPHVVRVADINADEKLDILVDDRTGGGVKVLIGDGAGRFGSTTMSIDLGGDPYLGFALGDLDADGLPDIAAPVSGRLTVALRATSKPERLATTTRAFAVALLDLNGDGHLDLVAASNDQPTPPQRFDGDGTGRLEQTGKYPSLPPGAKKIVVADLNGDGQSEAIIVNWSGGVTVVGDKASSTLNIDPSIKHPWGIAVCDLNDDGADDIIVTDGEAPQAEVVFGRRK